MRSTPLRPITTVKRRSSGTEKNRGKKQKGNATASAPSDLLAQEGRNHLRKFHDWIWIETKSKPGRTPGADATRGAERVQDTLIKQ
jgi:hypothetical protein